MYSRKLLLLHFVAALTVYSFRGTLATAKNDSGTLKLLVVLPLDVRNQSPSPWDRGLELLPAANLAVDAVNQKQDVLPAYELELVMVNSETCGHHTHSQTIIELLEHAVINQQDGAVVGITGLMCSSLTHAVSPIIGHPGIGLIQVSGATSPILQHSNEHPHLYRILPSSALYADAGLALLETFDWSRIGVIYSGGYDHYYLPTAIEFLQQAIATNITEIASIIEVTQKTVKVVIENLKHQGVKVVFAFLPPGIAADIICTAKQKELTWPNYAWIVQGHDIEDLISASPCGSEQMRAALSGVFLMNYQLTTNDITSKLVSGQTYAQYNNRYLERLKDIAEQTGMPLHPNSLANALHDSIWVFALALDKLVQEMNMSGEKLQIPFSPTKMNHLERALSALSFNGASGHVQFTETDTIGVDIFQVSDGIMIKVAHYDPQSGSIESNPNVTFNEVPDDQLEIKYITVSGSVATLFFLIGIVPGLLTTGILVLYLYYRNEPEIKASSPYLSLFMFLGSYLLYITVIIDAITRVLIIGGASRDVVCGGIIWSASLGFNFILAVVFVRLVRILYIFKHAMPNIGIFWRDTFLALEVMFIIAGDLVILIIWSVADTYYIEDEVTYLSTAQPPYYKIQQYCNAKYLMIWLFLVCGYVGVFMVIVSVLAFKTRKIKKKDFKDTKKVNVYIFMMVILICMTIPLWWIVRMFDSTVSGLIICTGYVMTAVLCQALLFVPKVIPPLLRQIKHRRVHEKVHRKGSSTGTGSYSTNGTLSTK